MKGVRPRTQPVEASWFLRISRQFLQFSCALYYYYYYFSFQPRKDANSLKKQEKLGSQRGRVPPWILAVTPLTNLETIWQRHTLSLSKGMEVFFFFLFSAGSELVYRRTKTLEGDLSGGLGFSHPITYRDCWMDTPENIPTASLSDTNTIFQNASYTSILPYCPFTLYHFNI